MRVVIDGEVRMDSPVSDERSPRFVLDVLKKSNPAFTDSEPWWPAIGATLGRYVMLKQDVAIEVVTTAANGWTLAVTPTYSAGVQMTLADGEPIPMTEFTIGAESGP